VRTVYFSIGEIELLSLSAREVLAIMPAILPRLLRRVQFPIPVGLNLLLLPGEHVLRRDVTDSAVKRMLLRCSE
jgi:hypothetical protein